MNQMLVSTVVALDTDQRVTPIFLADLRFQAMTAGVLAILAPVAALVVQTQPLMLPMLLAPIAAVYNSAQLAVAMGRQASHDALTGLANRELFRDRSVRALEESQTYRPGAGDHDDRPRPLQGDQRHARPPGRRRADLRGGPPARGGTPGRGNRRPPRRRRVRRPAARHPRPLGGRGRRDLPAVGARQVVLGRRRPTGRPGQPRHRALRPITATTCTP